MRSGNEFAAKTGFVIVLEYFLRDWDELATKTEIGIVLEFFCKIEVGLRIFLSEEKREEELDLENFCRKEKRERGSWT